MFINLDIIVRLVFEHTSIEHVVIQKLDTRATLLVFLEDVDVQRICTTLPSVEIWLGHSLTIMYNVAMCEQMSKVE